MKALLSNDDGIEAAGLAALAEAVAPFFDEVVVVAPHKCWSGCGHQTTTGSPIDIREVRPNWWVAQGTPADCVRLAMLHLAPDADWVFSGINHGGNLGIDVHMSGTVAAAREGSLFGRPAAAFSPLPKRERTIDWAFASQMVSAALATILKEPPAEGFLNVNLPHIDSGNGPPQIRESPLAKEQFRFRVEASDGALQIGTDYHARPRGGIGRRYVLRRGDQPHATARLSRRATVLGRPVDDLLTTKFRTLSVVDLPIRRSLEVSFSSGRHWLCQRFRRPDRSCWTTIRASALAEPVAPETLRSTCSKTKGS